MHGAASRHDGGVRGRRTAAVLLLLAALTTGCRGHQDADQDIGSVEPTAAATLAESIERLRAPRLVGELVVRLRSTSRVVGSPCVTCGNPRPGGSSRAM